MLSGAYQFDENTRYLGVNCEEMDGTRLRMLPRQPEDSGPP